VVAVIANAEAPLDEVGDALGGPQVGRPAVGACAAQQQGPQSLSLLGGEPGPGSGMRPGVEGAGAALGQASEPSVDGARVDPDAPCHLRLGEAGLEERDGPSSASLELSGGSLGSHGRQCAHRRAES
jgi:hypothetical protein